MDVNSEIYEVSVQNGMDGLLSIEKEWRKISKACQDVSYFQRYEWYLAYLRCLETQPEAVYFFLVTKDQVPVAIFPLKRECRGRFGIKLRCWLFPRASDEIVHSDFAAVNKEEVLPAFRAIQNKMHSTNELNFDAIIMRRIMQGGNAWELMTCTLGLKKIDFHHSYSKYLECDASTANQACGSGKFRRNLRRLEKRLSKKGSVSWHYISNVREQNAVFQEFLDVEATGWKGEGGTGTAIKFEPRVILFYQELMNSFGRMGLGRINLLKVDDVVIAGQYCLMDNQRINLLKIGYDEAYKDSSPGFLLIKNVLENGCINNDFTELSFVTGAQWNDIFQPKMRDVIVGYLFNKTLLGFLYLIVIKAEDIKLRVKHLLEKLVE